MDGVYALAQAGNRSPSSRDWQPARGLRSTSGTSGRPMPFEQRLERRGGGEERPFESRRFATGDDLAQE